MVHAESRRNNCFDAIRLFAALAVVVEHGMFHLDSPFLWARPHHLWFYDGVSLFFILSGMLVYRSAERCAEQQRQWRDYFTNRFLRIAPAIYAYLIITVVALLALGAISLRSIFTGQFLAWMTGTLALIPVFHPTTFRQIGVGVWNGSLWTIPTECSFYLIVPGLVLFANRWGKKKMLACTWVVVLVGLSIDCAIGFQKAESIPGKLYRVTFLPFLCWFALGMTWGYLWPKMRHSGWVAAVAAAMFLATRGMFEQSFHVAPLWQLVWGIPLSYAAIWFGYNAPSFFQFTSRTGDLSFGTYIWHMPIVNTLLYLGIQRTWIANHRQLMVPFLIVLTLTFAWLSWHFVERRALRLKPFTSRDIPSNKAAAQAATVACPDGNASAALVLNASSQ